MRLWGSTKQRWQAAGVAGLLLLSGQDCDRGRVDSNRPPEDREVDPVTKRTVIIRADSVEVPYTVRIEATDGKQGRDVFDDIVTERRFRTTLDYTSGIRIRIIVSVNGPVPGELVTCSITDGLFNRHSNDGNRRVNCDLTTAR